MQNLTNEEEAKVIQLINKVVEPQVNEIINKLNEILKSKNIQVGATIEWIYGKINNENKENKNEK